MPSLLGYVERKGELPKHLTFSIAALMAFYTGSEIRDKALIGHRNGQEYNIMDDMAVLEFFAANSSKPSAEFVNAVTAYLEDIRTLGMRKAIEKNF